MILVDSSVWIDYFNGASTAQADFLDSRLGIEPVAIGDLMLTEVLQGFRKEADYQSARTALLDFPVLTIGGQDIALAAADNYRALRSAGITIRKTIDTLIATFCIQRRRELLFSDRDFEPFVTHLGLRAALSI
ncbi:MAG: PIN domain nuclease [Pseudomonadota bacterium]|nr:PIN domain nuclease [Pseudomonadota bacterium]